MRHHVQNSAHVAAAAPPGATAVVVFSAIACWRSHADELGDLAAIELADLRTEREHRSTEHRAHARDALHQVALDAPNRRIAKEMAPCHLGFCNSSFQPSPVLVQAFAHGLGGCRVLALHFLNSHVHKLPTPAQQISQLAGLLILWQFGLRPDELGKRAKRPCIDGLDLGQLPAGTRRASYLARIDNRHHERTRRELAGQTLLESTRRFHHDQCRSQPLKRVTYPMQRGIVIAHMAC